MQFYNDFSQSLTKAEVRPDSSRDAKEAAINEYNSIAFNYEDQGDFVTASYFYQKVVDLSISCKVLSDECRKSSMSWRPCWGWGNATTRETKRKGRSRY